MLRRLITFWNSKSSDLSDLDAIAFYTAITENGGTLTKDEQKALNKLTVDLKTSDLWNKIAVLYPFIGGSAVSHSYNLKNPLQYQITWYGFVSHTYFGVEGDGVTGFGDTSLLPDLIRHFSMYSRTVTDSGSDAGSIANRAGSYFGFSLAARFFDGVTYFGVGDLLNPGNRTVLETINNGQGFFTLTQNPDPITYFDENSVFKNGVEHIRSESVKAGFGFDSFSAARGAGKIYILARRAWDFPWAPETQYVESFSNRQYAFMCFGAALTRSEVTILNNIVQEFQITLGRQV